MVVYVIDQSTESPSRRQRCSKTRSSWEVSCSHNATKLRRESETAARSFFFATGSGAEKSGS
jgi:hypothetical protein